MKKEIALVVHNLVLFDQMKPIVERYREKIDIYVEVVRHTEQDNDWLEMAKNTYDFLKKEKYSPKYLDKPIEKKYKVLLTSGLYENLPNAEVKIRYNYGMGKDWLHNNYDINFDYILVYGERDGAFSEPFARILEVGPIKFYNLKKNKTGKKKKVLYLPTYGEHSSIEYLYKELEKLQEKYEVIVKLHHGTTFLEPERVKLFKNFKTVYDHKEPLGNLLSKADVVVSDSSGAIYDAIAMKVPVIIYNTNTYELYNDKIEAGEVVLLKENLVHKIDKASELDKAILDTLTDKDKNKKLKKAFDMFFGCSAEEGVNRIFDLIDKILLGKLDLNIYHAAKNNLMKEIEEPKKEIVRLNNEINVLKLELNQKQKVLNDILNSKSWRYTKIFRRK